MGYKCKICDGDVVSIGDNDDEDDNDDVENHNDDGYLKMRTRMILVQGKSRSNCQSFLALQVASCKLQAASCKLQVASCNNPIFAAGDEDLVADRSLEWSL